MNDAIRAHQLVMLDMLSEIDRICKKYDISYMLYAGTLLGAVRYDGFIPWDDDLDVIMLRPEYDRFMEIAPQELQKEYFLQREFSEHWPMFFSKLRKNNTTCIERYIPKDSLMHQGIYVDIFPCDNLADNELVRKMQFAFSKVIIGKSLYKRGYLTDSKLKKIFMLMCRFVPTKPVLNFVQRRKDDNSQMVHSFFGGAKKYGKSIFPRKWFTETETITFEGREFPVPHCRNELLTVLYGNYMIPPPANERGCKIHAEIVDTDRSWEYYDDIRKDIQFTEYTRSIR